MSLRRTYRSLASAIICLAVTACSSAQPQVIDEATLTWNGIGPLVFGQDPATISRSDVVPLADPTCDAYGVTPKWADKGVRIEAWKDKSGVMKIQRIIVTDPSVATDKGVRVGMTLNRVQKLDPEATITPHSTDSGIEPVLQLKRDKLAIYFIHENRGAQFEKYAPNKSVDQIWLAASDDDLIGGC